MSIPILTSVPITSQADAMSFIKQKIDTDLGGVFDYDGTYKVDISGNLVLLSTDLYTVNNYDDCKFIIHPHDWNGDNILTEMEEV